MVLKMFKPDWSSLVKTMMVFSACQIKVYFMFLALNSVGYLPVANGFRLLISPLQKWLSEIWPDFRMILRYIFAACSQTSHKPVFTWALITCTTLFAHPSHEDFYSLLPMEQSSLSGWKGLWPLSSFNLYRITVDLIQGAKSTVGSNTPLAIFCLPLSRVCSCLNFSLRLSGLTLISWWTISSLCFSIVCAGCLNFSHSSSLHSASSPSCANVHWLLCCRVGGYHLL